MTDKQLLVEAIAIIEETLTFWGCDCPYCDRDFGKDFMHHEDKCRAKAFMAKANEWRSNG